MSRSHLRLHSSRGGAHSCLRLSISRSDTYALQNVHSLIDLDDAVGTQIRLRTTPIVANRTQWMSLSAINNNPSNREPYLCTYSIVRFSLLHDTPDRYAVYTVMDQRWSGHPVVSEPARLDTARPLHSCGLWPSRPTYARPGQAGWPLMAATTDGLDGSSKLN